MKNVLSTTAAILALALTQAHAGEIHSGLDFSLLDYQSGNPDASLSPQVVQFRHLIEPNRYFGFDFRLGTGVAEGKTGSTQLQIPSGVVALSNVKLQVDLLMGAFARASWPITPDFRLHLIAGLVSLETTRTAMAGGARLVQTHSDNNFSWGAGLDYDLDRSTVVSAEFQELGKDEEARITALNLGISRRF